MSLSRKKILAGLLLAPLCLLALLGLSELFFRFVVPAPELPAPAFVDGVLRHQAGERGVYWIGGVKAPFAINAQGWNSGRADYPLARTDALRIAVVGGALVEALAVPPDQSLAEDLERGLGPGTEVFRYGLGGAPLSQALHMARRAALPAHPDVLVVVVAPEDFEASYQEVSGLFTANVLKLRLDADDTVEELPPAPYRQDLLSRIRTRSATWRYLAYGRRLRFEHLREFFLRPGSDRRFEVALDTSGQDAREALNRRAARYLFAQLQAAATEAGARLLIVMDGARAGMEEGTPPHGKDGAPGPNRLAAREAGLLGIPFLDLRPAFAEDFARNHRPFGIDNDARWNAQAHAVAARAVAEKLRQLGWVRQG